MRKIIVASGFAVALFGTLAMEAAAQSSCSGWNAVCRQRCGQANCQRCDQQMAGCRKTGCWTEAPKFGGGKHCNLQKS
jgi:hypothetical protein